MQLTLRFILAILVGFPLGGERFAERQDIPYQVLDTRLPSHTDSIMDSSYVISVGSVLVVKDVQNLICRVFQQNVQMPADRIAIRVYYNLSEYVPPVHEYSKTAERLKKHQLAYYLWSNRAPDSTQRLALTMDARGKPLKRWQYYDFNHTKDCQGKTQ